MEFYLSVGLIFKLSSYTGQKSLVKRLDISLFTCVENFCQTRIIKTIEVVLSVSHFVRGIRFAASRSPLCSNAFTNQN